MKNLLFSKKSIFEFFENSENMKDELESFIGYKLHLLENLDK